MATVDTDRLKETGTELLEAMDTFARELNAAGARDSDNDAVARFSSYHLADLEGNDGGAGWLASNLLADALRSLINSEIDGDESDGDETADAVAYIRDRFGSMRESFLSDPGGYLAAADAPMTDEVARAAIDIITEEWKA